MKIYSGEPDHYTVRVKDGDRIQLLNPRFDVYNHSPTGFCWGYNGSGPAQLALAILCDVFTEADLTGARPSIDRDLMGAFDPIPRAQKLYQRFKDRIISRFPMESEWTLTEQAVWAAVASLERER